MLLDLLRLASIGQNMELYASLRVREPSNSSTNFQQQQYQQARSEMPSVIQQVSRTPGNSEILQQSPRYQPSRRCPEDYKPLDLTVKTLPEQHNPSGNNLATKQTTSEMSLSVHKDGVVRLRLKSRAHPKIKKSATLQGKHITSTTSPSRSASSVSSVDSTMNPHAGNCEIISSTNLVGSNNQEKKTISGQLNTHPHGSLSPKRRKQKGAKSHLCNQCGRSFSRSDMLTRHSRLHSGLKPYQCSRCKQVFSRSDHLSTHERTHTGEKPYQCQFCSYSACRRDMITRHLRIHSSRPHIRGGRKTRKVKSDKIEIDKKNEDVFDDPTGVADDSNSTATSLSDACDSRGKNGVSRY